MTPGSTSRGRSPFLILGLVGYVFGCALAMVAAARSGGSPATVGVMAGVAATTFFTVAFATKVATGAESLTFYHHALALVGGVSLVLLAMGAPITRNLDYAVLGLAAFLTFGRLGCLWVGCCHGRPARWGVRYSETLVPEGFPHHLVGAPLIPVQALEALACAVITAVAAIGIVGGWRTGAGIVWCGGAYAATRFSVEFWRGDERRYHAGLSTPQLTSCGIAGLLLVLSVSRTLPGSRFLWVVAVVISIEAGPTLWRRVRGHGMELTEPGHVHEIADLLGTPDVSRSSGQVLSVTSQGLVLSADRCVDGDRVLIVYSFSHVWRPLHERVAKRVARAVRILWHRDLDYAFLAGRHDNFHLVLVTGDRGPIRHEVGPFTEIGS
jgi:prolipoprotein diacylglyceryltransferase